VCMFTLFLIYLISTLLDKLVIEVSSLVLFIILFILILLEMAFILGMLSRSIILN